MAYNNTLKMGILPVALFASGHTFFTQKMFQTLKLQVRKRGGVGGWGRDGKGVQYVSWEACVLGTCQRLAQQSAALIPLPSKAPHTHLQG